MNIANCINEKEKLDISNLQKNLSRPTEYHKLIKYITNCNNKGKIIKTLLLNACIKECNIYFYYNQSSNEYYPIDNK